MNPHPSSLTVYRGPAGDHNDRAMSAATLLGEAFTRRLGISPVVVGSPEPAQPTSWDRELRRALPTLQRMAERIDQVMTAGQAPISVITRCAVALASQPVVLRHRPDAVVVWFDAHGDINVPADTTTGYLGGLALAGPLGWWDSGLGGGLPEQQAVLVGARDLDPAEIRHVTAGRVALVPPGRGLDERLADVLRGRPAYLHVDCDVMEPGLFTTDYTVPGGLSLDDLHACAKVLAVSAPVGAEIAEFEGNGSATADDLVAAIEPLLTELRR
ncbi:arginase family protein [Kitasatospora sp. NPDC002965]|uniref:arginase family protein n=1 Tax=Kitasatospora sp. NPDC002965 TaxID=3154775 RepID=UPI0033A7A86A